VAIKQETMPTTATLLQHNQLLNVWIKYTICFLILNLFISFNIIQTRNNQYFPAPNNSLPVPSSRPATAASGTGLPSESQATVRLPSFAGGCHRLPGPVQLLCGHRTSLRLVRRLVGPLLGHAQRLASRASQGAAAGRQFGGARPAGDARAGQSVSPVPGVFTKIL
jgi:hypothetical protein